MAEIETMLRDLSLSGAVFLDGELAGDWAVHSQMTPADFPGSIDPDGRMISYHFIRQGPVRCRLAESEGEVELQSGDMVILTRNDPHVLAGGEVVDPIDARVAMGAPDAEGIHRVNLPGESRQTLYCGYLGGPDHPLIDALPPMMVVHTRDHAEWVERSFELIVDDLRRAAPTLVAQMAAGIFVEAVRRFVADHPDANDMVASLSDPIVRKALALIQENPARQIPVAELAAHAGTSRSVLMERFTSVLGCGPTAYRNRLRLSRAASQLRNSGLRVAEIGFAAGYESEEGFSRAFKKRYGRAPKAYRKQESTAGPVQSGSKFS